MREFEDYKQVVKRAVNLFDGCLDDWSFDIREDGYWLFESWSPAGENLPIEGRYEGEAQGFINHIADELKAVAECFGVDEHVGLWLDSRGEKGVPRTARELIEDAEAIQTMYDELAMKFTRMAQLFYSDGERVTIRTLEEWTPKISQEDMETYYRVKELFAQQDLAHAIENYGLLDDGNLIMTHEDFSLTADKLDQWEDTCISEFYSISESAASLLREYRI